MENEYRFEFIVRDGEGGIIFAVDKPSLEMLEEEIGRYERHFKLQDINY